MKLLKTIERYLICIILVIVGLFQLYHSQFDSLTPWKGGGFGMFSTNKRTNITAVGYTSYGDSVLINVIGSKYDVPISRSFLMSTKNFPKEEKLEKLGDLIVNSYLRPTKLEIPNNLDSQSADLIGRNKEFYDLIYVPEFYQNAEIANSEKAIVVNRVKITLFETDFFEKDLLFKKRYVDEIQVERSVNE